MSGPIFNDGVLVSAGDLGGQVQQGYLKLYADLIDHVIDFTEGGLQAKELRLMKRAVQSAIETVIHARKWQYFYRAGRVHLVTPYTTGTVSYNPTTRIVTLTGGAFPEWAAYGRLRIGLVVGEVEARLSATELRLREAVTFGDELQEASYSLFRSHYVLPQDFRSLVRPENENWGSLHYISPEEWLWRERGGNEMGTPLRFTVMASPETDGQYVLVVDPDPATAETVDFIYQAAPPMLRRTGYETASQAGTISITAGSVAVTGAGTSFSQDMVGSYMRFQAGDDYPTGLEGDNPYTEQHRISSVTNATTLTLATPVSQTYADKKYIVSDAVLLDRTLFQTVLRAAERELAILANLSRQGDFEQRYHLQLMQALEWDSKVELDFSAGRRPYWFNYRVVL